LAQVAVDDLEIPEELSRRKLRTRLLFLAGLVLAVVAIVTLLPGSRGCVLASRRPSPYGCCWGWD
jgi:hypothetical protein